MNREKSRAKGIVVSLLVFSIVVITILFLFALNYFKKQNSEMKTEDNYGQIIIRLNQVIYENEDNKNASYNEKINEVMDFIRDNQNEEDDNMISYLIVTYLVVLLIILLIYVVVYVTILKPFDKLENYASDIAAGNFDSTFDYNRINIFGQFTWAFDHMRTQITIARRNEQEAIEKNKTVIATLSHDIKTPIASIRGYAEALSDNMDTSEERRKRYFDVIMKKCDEVTKITNDMFIHSLHDLDKLTFKREDVQIGKLLSDTVNAMNDEQYNIEIDGKIYDATLKDVDGGRIEQVLENVISNAGKYASGSKIQVSTEDSEENYIIKIRDYGKGISDDDLPFIFEKFYRGKNILDKPGAGLGLFIVQFAMKNMGGKVVAKNANPGLEISLIFKKNIHI